MAQHGYLREYDEDFRGEDRGDWDRGDRRERGERDWQDRERGREFMFGEDNRDRGAWENNRDWPQRERGSQDYRREERNFRSHPDDHYRSWRDRQMQSLDRDYEDYCREREQQFHQDFDSWRQNRQQQRGSQGQPGGSSEQVMELDNPTPESGETQGAGSSPTGAATLGTNNSENSTTGRGRR